MEWRSQHGEDEFIAPLLKPDRARFVVDVGANDGYSWSNSYAFVKQGFRALLVEPMARYAGLCRYYHEGNENVIVEEAAILDYEGRTKFFISDHPESDMLAMRSSVVQDYVHNAEMKSYEVEVACAPLSALLARHNVPTNYALLSVDAEGVDLKVLQTAKLQEWRPQVICVEHGLDGEAISAYLATQAYQRHADLGANTIYLDAR